MKHKKYDSVFTTLFSDKKYLCQLFNVLHNDIDICEDDIENVTLNCILIDSLYNDLGFTAKNKMLILVEAQSTWSPNIATRLFFYACETYKKTLNRKYLYRSKIVPLPEPEFYVVYTGNKIVPKTLSLAKDIFNNENANLDLKVNILTNSKDGDILNQYVSFTKVLKEQIAKYGQAIQTLSETIKICQDKNILTEFLKAHETEVLTMADFLFDQEVTERNYGLDRFKEGALQQKEKDDIIIAQNNMIIAQNNMVIAQNNEYIKQLEAQLQMYKIPNPYKSTKNTE